MRFGQKMVGMSPSSLPCCQLVLEASGSCQSAGLLSGHSSPSGWCALGCSCGSSSSLDVRLLV
eukprot:16421808-Heterocapsa_arctica.AAC.1